LTDLGIGKADIMKALVKKGVKGTVLYGIGKSLGLSPKAIATLEFLGAAL
jgi:L-asparaginase/Glu-tRNA(Gln) amidotransferase subunit D